MPDPSRTGENVTPRTAALYRTLAATGQLRKAPPARTPTYPNPDSDHPRGRACDLFFHPKDPPTSTAAGPRPLADHASGVYGLHYLIWQGHIWSAEQPQWITYRSPIFDCPNPANLSGCHYDHIHISLYQK